MKELQNLWSQYFGDGKTESDLIEERPPFLLKRKLSNIFWKDSWEGAYIRNKRSGMKSNWADDLRNNIEEILGEDSDLEVNEIKERLVKNIQKILEKIRSRDH